jgi:S1-C subfamily serine protease
VSRTRELRALAGSGSLLTMPLCSLLAGFESATTDVAAGIGLTLEAAHLARARRQAVGLSDTPGLLVTEVAPGSAAGRAGIERGDLITAVAGVPTASGSALALLLDDLAGRPRVSVTLLRGNEQASAELELVPSGNAAQR